MPAYVYVWEFRVRADREAEFRDAYGPEGAWVQLFRRAPGYVRSELLQDGAQPGRYLTIDYWETEEAWREFRTRFAAEYQAIDARCEALMSSEKEIGEFTAFARP